MRVGELRVVGFPSFTVFRVPERKEEVFSSRGSFFQSMCGLTCKLGTVLNILCLLRNQGLLPLRCEPLCFCVFQKCKYHFLRSFLRL